MNSILLRLGSMVAGGAVMCLLGGTAALAASWGTLTVSHNGTAQGKGKGTLSYVGVSNLRLTSKLGDLHKDNTRTYAQAYYQNGTDAGSFQSGRRSDGESKLAAMKNRQIFVAGTRGYKGKVKVCQDVPLRPDWCSSYSKLKTL